jgi:Na+-driven multidrug efflux pump
MAEVFTILVAVAVVLWSEGTIRIFNSEPEMVELAGAFLKIQAVGFLVMGFSFVLQHSISGAGDTMPPMLVTLLNFWLVQIPLAYFLPKVANLGVYGVRWAIVAGMMAGAMAYITYFWLGRWKCKRV